MASLLDLAKRCERWRKRIPEEANRIKKEVAQEVATDLIVVTPVDESTALSNWQAANNEPTDFPLPAIYPGERGSTESASTAEAIAHAERVIKETAPGEPLYVSNVLDYIVPLNDGTSSQEPAGFVERAILLGRIKVREARVKLNGD